MCARKTLPQFYPTAILAMSLSLQLYKNLITNYVIGADIQSTFYFADLVRSAQVWSPRLIGDSPLTVLTVISTFYSLLLNLNLEWVFKIVNSFLYALTPVCIFYIFKNTFGEREGFYASLFFAFQNGFIVYGTPGKQPLAELFMALLLLSMVDKGIGRTKRSFFAVLFSLAMINSHYGVPLIFVLSLIMAHLIFRFMGKNERTKLLSFTFIPFFFVLFLSWFMYTAEGEISNRFVRVGVKVLNQAWLVISTQKILPRTGAAILTESHTLLRQVNLIIYMTLTIFMVIGVLHKAWNALWKRKEITELDAIAISLLIFLFVSFAIAGNFGIDRMYVLTSVVLSGYILHGFRKVVEIFKHGIFNRAFTEQRLHMYLALLLSIFLLFNSGLVYQLAGVPISSAISLNSQSNTLAYTDAEMSGARWLKQSIAEVQVIYSDKFSSYLLYKFYPLGYSNLAVISLEKEGHILYPTDLHEGSVVYIRAKSITDVEKSEFVEYIGSLEIEQIVLKTNKIYESNGCKIFSVHVRALSSQMHIPS